MIYVFLANGFEEIEALAPVDFLKRAGVDVVLCTPSATPPQWLVNKYPECLQMLSDGLRVHHGGRKRQF